MMALTLDQPWASLVALGLKVHETRGWRTDHRGPLLIHASPAAHLQGLDLGLLARRHANEQLARRGLHPVDLPRNALVAVVDLVDCAHPGHRVQPVDMLDELFGDWWSPGRYAWRLDNPRLLVKPIHCDGGRRLWPVPDSVLVKVPPL